MSKYAIRKELHFGDRVINCYADRPNSLHAKLEQAFSGDASRIAVVDDTGRVTLGELKDRIERAAAYFWAKGIRAKDRVVMIIPNRIGYVTTLLGLMRIGAIPVPVNIREAEPEIRFIMEDCTAAALIYDTDCAAARSAAAALPAPVWAGEVGEVWAAPIGPYEMPPTRPADDCVCLIYTSGTTGKPKGAMLSDLGILHSMLHYEEHAELGPDDTGVLVVPATHITGLIGLVMATLGAGGKLVMMQGFNTRDFVRVAAAERITYTILVPAMYNLLLLREDLSAHDLSSWRVGAYGGAVMPVPTIEALAESLPRLNLVNAYGATETTSPTTIMPLGADRSRFASIGKLVACAEVVVMDETGVEVPHGTEGELWIKGPMVVPGYWNRPETTAKEFVNGYWRSGDIGQISEDGFLSIHDRKKDMINRGGYKIFSAEVESVLLRHEAVIEAAAIGRPDPVLGERVHVYLVLKEGGCDPEALKALCRHELADYKVPETFTVLATALPRNANGKVLKRELKEMLVAQGG